MQDPFNEDDWDSYTAFTAKGLAQVVGDDLLCTNPKRVQKAIDTKACNALLLKVNQVRGACGRAGPARSIVGWGSYCLRPRSVEHSWPFPVVPRCRLEASRSQSRP